MCVGGIWPKCNKELIEAKESEPASLVMVDGLVSSHVCLTVLSVCLHPRREQHKDKRAGFAKNTGK